MLRPLVLIGCVAALGTLSVASAHSVDKPIVLEGTIATPDAVIRNGRVVIEKGRIASVGPETLVAIPADSVQVRTNGIIYPGLIDLHNHVSWDFLPRWNPPQFYDNRYEWRGLKPYTDTYARWSAQLQQFDCARSRYGELKALLGGVTAIEGVPHGKYGKPCVMGLLRSLNYYSGYTNAVYTPFYDILDVSSITPEEAKVIREKLTSGEITCFVLHLAEGRRDDGESQYEFTVLQNYGLLTNKTALIHATALSDASIQMMAQNGVRLIWSPRSNLMLYGQTTDIRAAKKDGVLIALAPDWSITGSDNMLDELKVARLFFDGDTNDNGLNRDLVLMVTSNAAKIAGLAGEIGALKPGYAADLVVVRGDPARPYGSLVNANVQNVDLVMIDGQPYYGSPEIMKLLGQEKDSESIKVCGEPKLLHLRDNKPPPGALEVTSAELRQTLTTAITQVQSPRPSLADLYECH